MKKRGNCRGRKTEVGSEGEGIIGRQINIKEE